jgi:orotidine-5'-phosphate decarboxylase
MALAAAACDEKSIDSVRLHGSLGTLREVIEQGGQVDKSPELFCFGLLAAADIKDLSGLVAPRQLHFVEPSVRAQKELSGLADRYEQHGVDFDPLAP